LVPGGVAVDAELGPSRLALWPGWTWNEQKRAGDEEDLNPHRGHLLTRRYRCDPIEGNTPPGAKSDIYGHRNKMIVPVELMAFRVE